MIVELEVYSHSQWTNRNDPKGCYIVTGELRHLRAFAERWMARDKALDPTGMSEYHVFCIDPNGNLTREELDSLGDELLAFDMLIHPTEYETCEHGLSASLCCGPQHYPMDM
jgi:hypothetical protein